MQRKKQKKLSDEKKTHFKAKRWFIQTKEKQDEMREKAREYSKNTYYNHIVMVKSS